MRKDISFNEHVNKVFSSVLQTGRVRFAGSGTGYKKKFGPGTNMIAYPDPDR